MTASHDGAVVDGEPPTGASGNATAGAAFRERPAGAPQRLLVQADLPSDRRPPPGQMPVVMAALSIGIVLMAVQLWLLTVALDLFMSGAGAQVWQTAAVSGAIFLGGLLVLWLLGRRPGSPPRMGPLPESTFGPGRRTGG